MGDRHKNFEDSMFFLKHPFHSFYIQFLNPPFFWDTLYVSGSKNVSYYQSTTKALSPTCWWSFTLRQSLKLQNYCLYPLTKKKVFNARCGCRHGNRFRCSLEPECKSKREGFLHCQTPTSAVRLEVEGCRLQSEEWRVEDCGWRMESVRLRVKNKLGWAGPHARFPFH